MDKHIEILNKRFGKDSLIALATVDSDGTPWVRTVNAVFYGDSFYTITYALSKKMEHIKNNPTVAIGGEWFSAHAIVEDLGHIKLEKNKEIADMLRSAFAAWYGNGHNNEDDPNTVILRMKITDGILFSHGTKYEI